MQTWLEFAVDCGYLERDTAADLYKAYDGTIVGMINRPETWVLSKHNHS